MDSITIIFKAVEKCNSNCVYCETVKKHQEMIMSYDLLETVFFRINEYLVQHPDNNVHLTWHGGEVCLLGADYINEAVEIQEKYCSQTKHRIIHLVQSNLTLITNEIVDAFKNLGIDSIGSSYEPIPGIRGFGKNRDSGQYNKLFMKGINLLYKNNMNWGIIYVVNRKSLERPLEIFHFLTNLNMRSGPNINKIICYDESKHDLHITPEEYAHFLGAIFPFWWKNKNRYTNVVPFSRIIHNLTHEDKKNGCELSGDCSYNWLYIGPTGETSQCGRSGDYDTILYGNIQNLSFQEILGHKFRDQFVERQRILPQTECKDCRFWKMCHGGCPFESFFTYGDFTHRTPYCSALTTFMEEYVEPITGLKADMKPEYEYRFK